MKLDQVIADLQNLSRSYQNPEVAFSVFPKIELDIKARFETVEILGNSFYGLKPTKTTKQRQHR